MYVLYNHLKVSSSTFPVEWLILRKFFKKGEKYKKVLQSQMTNLTTDWQLWQSYAMEDFRLYNFNKADNRQTKKLYELRSMH